MSTDSPKESLGDRIRFVRSSRGWSQAHLAELAGMKKAQLSRYEVGASVPRSEVLHRIAMALGVSPAWLGGDSNAAINDGEIPGGGKTVPIPPEAMEMLLALSTKLQMSMADVMHIALENAIKQFEENPPQKKRRAKKDTGNAS